MILSSSQTIITILLFTFTLISKCFDFHLQRKIIVPALDVTVNNIIFIDDDNLVVSKINGDFTDIAIYRGSNFEQKQKQLIVRSNISKPKVTSRGIYSNEGKEIKETPNLEKINSFDVDYAQGNLYVNFDKKYALISRKTYCPTLFLLNFTTMKSSQIQYQQGENCTFDGIGLVKQIGTQQLVYAAGSNLYILNSFTLNVKQKLQQDKKYQGIDFVYLDIFYDQLSNKATILVKGSGYSYQTFMKDGQKYQQQGRYYTPTSLLFCTGLNKGVSFQNNNLYQWQDMSSNILTIDFEGGNQYLGGKLTLAVSQSQQFFVLRSIIGTDLFFYSISEDYTIENIFNLSFLQFMIISTDDQPVQFTSDDRYLFLLMYKEYDNRYWVCRIDVENKNYTYIGSTQANCSTFAVLDLILYNRVISICSVANTNQSTNNLDEYQFKYFLELRTVNTLQLIKQQQLITTFNNPVFKLLSYNVWKQFFVIQIKQYEDGQETDQCQTILYKLKNSQQFIKIQNNSDISFQKIEPAGNFIISLKYFIFNQYQNKQNNNIQDYMKIYHISNLSLFTSIYIPFGSQQTANYIYSEKNILLIQSNYDLYRLDIYDFSSDTPQQWYQGSLFKQYFTKTVDFYQADHIIFPNKKLYYLYNTGPLGTGKPTKLIYNISQPPIKNILDMSPQKQTNKTLNPPEDYLYIRTSNLTKCPLVFYLLEKQLYKFYHCKPYKPIQRYFLDPNNKYVTFLSPKILLASSQKHIIIIYSILNYKAYIVEVRDIQFPDIKVYEYLASQQIWNADYNDGLFIRNSRNIINISNTQIKQFSDMYQMKNFTLFDTNFKGCLAFSGPIINQQIKSRIIFKASSEAQAYQQWDSNQKINILKIDDNCKMFVIHKSVSNMIEVWTYSPDFSHLYSQKFEKVQDIKFAGNQYIVVSLINQVKIVKFQPFQEDKNTTLPTTNKNILETSLTPIYEVSHDGKISVKSLDLGKVIITQIGSINKQLTFIMPQGQYVSGFSFTSNNSLAISSQLNNLYFFTPSPCLPTYVNRNLNCVCRDHSIQIFQLCQCKTNFFVDQFQNCYCPQTFYYTKNDQCLCMTGFAQDQVCKQCSFPCKTCTGSANNCDSYQTSFKIIVIGLCVVVLVVSIGIIYAIKRSRNRKDENDTNQELSQHLQD